MKNVIHLVIFFSCVILFNKSYAQIPESDKILPKVPLTLEDNVNKSDVVVEGQVINDLNNDVFLLDPLSRRPYTSMVIRVSRIFKGEIKDTCLEIITDGGRIPSGEFKGVGGPTMWGLLWKGKEGIFFLRPNTTNIQSGKHIQSFFYLYPQSQMLYQGGQPHYPITHDGKKRYDNLENELYPAIEIITGTPAKVVGRNSFEVADASRFDPKNYDGQIPLSDKIKSYTDMTLEQKVNNSDIVIEGEVLSMDITGPYHPFIIKNTFFTPLIIRVSRIFKGDIKDTIMELVTDGHLTFPNGSYQLSRWGMLSKGDNGIFFLRVNNTDIRSGNHIQSCFYIYPHSFIQYSDNLTFYEGKRLSSFENDLYKPIEAITGVPVKVLADKQYK